MNTGPNDSLRSSITIAAALLGAARQARREPRGQLEAQILRLTCEVGLAGDDQVSWLERIPSACRFAVDRKQAAQTGAQTSADWFFSSTSTCTFDEVDCPTLTVSRSDDGVAMVILSVDGGTCKLDGPTAAKFIDLLANIWRLSVVADVMIETEEIVDQAIKSSRVGGENVPLGAGRLMWGVSGLCITYYAVLASLLAAVENLTGPESTDNIVAAEMLSVQMHDQNRSQWLRAPGGDQLSASLARDLELDLDWAEAGAASLVLTGKSN